MPTDEFSNAPFTVQDLQQINVANWQYVHSFFYSVVCRKLSTFKLPLEDLNEITLFCIERVRRGSTSPKCRGLGSLVVLARKVATSKAVDSCRRARQMDCVALESMIGADGVERLNSELIRAAVIQRDSDERQAQRADMIHTALCGLAPDERKLIEDVYLDKIPIPTVAKLSGMKCNAVYQRLHRARQNMRCAVDQLRMKEGV